MQRCWPRGWRTAVSCRPSSLSSLSSLSSSSSPSSSSSSSSSSPSSSSHPPPPKPYQPTSTVGRPPPIIHASPERTPPATRNGRHGRPRHGILSSVSQPIHRGAQWVAYVLAVFFGIHVFASFFYAIDICHGISMMPTILSFGEWVCISKYYRRGRYVAVGDIVSFKSPLMDGEDCIKRVIALPGDFVLMNTPGKSDDMIQIPEGHCWVVGDNLAFSRDSRGYGPVPMGLITGKVLFKFTFRCYIPWDFESLQQGLQSIDESDVD